MEKLISILDHEDHFFLDPPEVGEDDDYYYKSKLE